MSLSGPEALRSLDEALRDIRREEDEIAKRLARSAELVTKIRATEGELFRQLAKVRLDPTVQDELSGRLRKAEIQAREQLEQHSLATTQAESRLKALDKTITALGTERGEKLSEIETHQAALKVIAERLAASSTRDPELVAAEATAIELDQVASEAMAKTEQAEADREIKGKPYRDDPLFMYLYERGYATSAYKAGNLIAWLDGLVARKIGYHKARPNFVMLNEIPLRLREHAERQLANAEAAEQARLALHTAAIDAAGGREVRVALEAAQARIAAIDEAIVAAEDERDEAVKAQRELAQGSDPKFQEAITALGETLSREDIRSLLEEARQTRSAQDDTIVQQIDDARRRAAEEESETREQKQRLKVLADRRRELEDIQFEFKKSRFDDPRSVFREDKLVGDLLTDFLRGGITAASYWDHWRKSQNWTGGAAGGPWTSAPQRRKHDDDDDDRRPTRGRGSSFNWPDMSIGGGSSSGGRSRSSGFGGSWGKFPSSPGGFSRPRGTGGGGFKTGGGFKSGGGFKTGGGF